MTPVTSHAHRKNRYSKIIGSLATALVLAVGSVTVAAQPATAAPTDGLADLVNPFVGTDSEGNAYPGATTPFGMVQLSPDNANSYGYTSYNPNTNWIWGFSHRHINSAGCPAAGEILVSPTTSTVPQTSRAQLNKKSGGVEAAHAGYYTVELANDVTAEVTATTRTGFHRYTFPGTATANLSFNVGQTLRDAGASEVSWIDDHTLEGWVENGGFCGSTPQKQKVFFSAEFDRAATSTGIWGQNGQYQAGVTESAVASGHNGAAAVFDTTDDPVVEVTVGISFVDVEGARDNRITESDNGEVTFDKARELAESTWDDHLGRIDITASNEARIIFYTQLYKSLLSPTIGSDVDGRYFGMDHQVHQADGWNYHQTFSLWDTYRTQATLHGLFEKDYATDIVRSMFQHRVEGGWFPRWSLGAIETNIMAGDPVSAWVAENFTLGTVPDEIADQMWEYLVENADTPTPDGVMSVGRQSADFYIENKHIPFYFEDLPGLGQQYEEYRHGGSSTMEFAISDAAIGAAAQRLGKNEDAARYLERGQNWQRLWNDEMELSGGFQGIVNAVHPDGTFNAEPNELASVQQSGFHEGTRWQYQWMANQDFAGLHEKMGGIDDFIERLDHYMAMESLLASPGQSPSHWAPGGSAYYVSIGYNPGNEPTIMNPWLYSSVGRPAAVNDVLSANLNRFPNTPGGGVGNDDLGTMSSWYVMATLGFQPIVPGSGMFALNAPRVEAATVTIGDGQTLTITASGAHESLPRYIEGLEINGKQHSKTWFDLDDIQVGGSLNFTLTEDRDTTWGTAQADWLPSVAAPVQVLPQVTATDATFQATVESTAPLGTVSFADMDSSVVPITADLVIDEVTYPVTVTSGDDGWNLALTATLPKSGDFTGTLTIRPSESRRFAPDPFAPVTSSVGITVTAKPDEPGPDPEPDVITGPTPKVTGKAKVGKTLRAEAGTWQPAPVTLTYQWLRNGKPIKGATAARYKLVKADAGRKIRVRVTGAKPGYAPVVATSAVNKVKRFKAKVKGKAPKRTRVGTRPKITVKVNAAVKRPKGQVIVRVAGKKVTKKLKAKDKSKIKVALPRISRAGTYRPKVRFKPTGNTKKRTAQSKVVRFTIRVRS